MDQKTRKEYQFFSSRGCPSLDSTSERCVSPPYNNTMVLYPCTWPLAPTAAWVWWLAQSLICSYRWGHFFLLFFTMHLTTTLAWKNTTGYVFLGLPNVHILHIFTFTVYVNRHVRSNTCWANQAITRVSSISSRSKHLQLPNIDSHSFGCTQKNGAKVNLVGVHVSSIWDYPARAIWVRHGGAVKGTHRMLSSTQDQMLYHANVWRSNMPTYWAASITVILYFNNSCERYSVFKVVGVVIILQEQMKGKIWSSARTEREEEGVCSVKKVHWWNEWGARQCNPVQTRKIHSICLLWRSRTSACLAVCQVCSRARGRLLRSSQGVHSWF